MCIRNDDLEEVKKQFEHDGSLPYVTAQTDINQGSCPSKFTDAPGTLYFEHAEVIGTADGFTDVVDDVAFLFNTTSAAVTTPPSARAH